MAIFFWVQMIRCFNESCTNMLVKFHSLKKYIYSIVQINGEERFESYL